MNAVTPPVAQTPRPSALARLSGRGHLVLAAALVVVPVFLFLLGLAFISVLRRASSSLGYGAFADLGYFFLALLIPAGIVAAVVVLLVGRRRAGVASVGGVSVSAVGSSPVAPEPSASQPPPGSADRGHLFVAAALLLGPILLFLAGLMFVMMLRRAGYPLGYDWWVDIGFIVLALLIPAGIVAALVVLVLGRGGRGTSLRTRAFVVIAIVVLVPSLCLAGFGVWAYYKSWDRAAALYEGQATYRAQLLQNEIEGLNYSPAHFTAAEKARLAVAIVGQHSWYGHPEGAVQTSLAYVRQSKALPAWMVRALAGQGWAIGNAGAPATRESPHGGDVVAWVGPKGIVYVYAAGWSAPSQITAYAPITRLFWIGALGVALIIILGLLGAWILSRSVVRPVRRLAVASGRLAEGEAGVTVTPQGPRELRELAVSFNDMNTKLTKAQETEQAFLLSVSHELKTPLTSIRGYAEGIGDGTVKPDDGAEVIGAESSRLERLVGDLLESGRMRKSAFTVCREPVDLAAVADDVMRRYEATARDAGLTLLINTGAGGGAVADHDRVLQVVSNLVENAIRCTPAPGTVTITTAPGAITVSDTGRGLTSDDLPRAFERFYLYSRYGTDRPVGTGLGLAIVKELTGAMGGTVSVSSAVGVGSAFTVALPPDGSAAAAGTAPGAQAAAPATPASGSGAPATPTAVTEVRPAAPAAEVPAADAATMASQPADTAATAAQPPVPAGSPDPAPPAAPQDDAS